MEPIITPVQEITVDSDRIIHNTEVDFVTRSLPNRISLVQYDDSLPIIAVAMKNNGEDYVLPSGAACNIRVNKSDGTTMYSSVLGCDSTRKIAYIEVDDDMTGAAGNLETTIEVIVSGDVAGTSPLNILIEPNPVSNADVLLMRNTPTMQLNITPEPITTEVEEVTVGSDHILHHTSADLVLRNVPNVIKLVQYDDKMPVIAVDLKSEGINYVLPEGAACNIRIKKPDGKIVYNPAYGCDVTRSVVYFIVTQQMTAIIGELDTIIEVVVTGKIAGTSPIRVRIEKNPIQDGDIDSHDEKETIIALVGQAEEARDLAIAAADSAEDSASSATDSATQASGSATAAAGSATSAAGSASDASGSATQASTSASTASSAATTATTQATKAESYAVGGTSSRTGEDTDNAKYYKEQAEAAAAMLDAEKILGNFASYESTSAASKAYKVGEFLTYNGYLYRVTTAIAQGGTITPGTNVVQTSVGDEIANRRLWFKDVTVNGITGSIIDCQDSRITSDYVLEGNSITWGDESKITSLTNWSTDTAGHFIVTGVASSATTATFALVKADDKIEPVSS